MIKENFVKLYEEGFKKNWDLPALSDYTEKQTLYYKDLAKEIARLHLLFNEAGIKKGDKIALIGKNNIPWCIVYLATVHYGAVIVPILQDFKPDGIYNIIGHSESKILFTSTSIWDTLNEQEMPDILAAYSINDVNYQCLLDRDTGKKYATISNTLDEKMAETYPKGFSKDDVQYADVDNAEMVLINYTSGTTGFSKGVMLSANNLAGNVTHANYLKLLTTGQRIVSFLPLAHAYGCAFEFLFSLSVGAHTTLLGKAPTPTILLEAFAEVKPHLIISVPLVIEKIYKKSILPTTEKPTTKLLLKIPGISGIIYKKIGAGLRKALGGNFHTVIVGGAALNPDVENFLTKIGFPITVGYGMTECAPLISYDHSYNFAPSSCGKVLDNIMEVRINSTDPYNVAGEIQVKGENVMLGYYKNEEATAMAFTEDGWLRTGDLGTIDKGNRIFIRGRSKSMILGSGGQNIYPEEIEARLNNMPYVSESIVIERKGKIVALIHPDYEALEADLISDEMIENVMRENKNILNKMVANYEQVNDFELYDTEFEKTPKKSIKRYIYENQ